MKFEKLVLLGHSDGGVPIVMDHGFEIFGCKEFLIVKNLDKPDSPFPEELYWAQFLFDYELEWEKIDSLPVQFGVHNAHVKFLVFRYFHEKYGLKRSKMTNLIHSKAYLATSAESVSGALIEPMVVVSSMAKVGFGVTIKRSASIGHHSILGDFVNVNPGAVLSGYVKVGMGTEIGSGAVISNNVTIGERCLIGAGSVVTRDIPDGVIAYGNPCKVVRENERWANIALEK